MLSGQCLPNDRSIQGYKDPVLFPHLGQHCSTISELPVGQAKVFDETHHSPILTLLGLISFPAVLIPTTFPNNWPAC